MISTRDKVLKTSRDNARVKTIVEELSLQEKKQLVSELLGIDELKEVWNDVFDRKIEHYLETEGQLYDIFATLADRFGQAGTAPEEMSLPH